ncbi:C4b-binding protein alpha chain-like isoform X3 [Hemitrygon akajei]|uniref:C4b-binding protein alpha chain-like isoform X3 n=1 Tax=Hemitrygon akajei TaxID=2704970 RepID=UPI003BF9D4FD
MYSFPFSSCAVLMKGLGPEKSIPCHICCPACRAHPAPCAYHLDWRPMQSFSSRHRVHPLPAVRMAAVLLLVLLWARAAEAEECNRPPKLENGLLHDKYLQKKTFASGSKVSYVCNPGYTFPPYSRKSIICNEGVWEPLQATCTPKSCGSPGEIMNGYYQGDNTFGSNVTFYCNEGYKLVGRNSRLCQTDGWGGQVPTCEAVKCPDIPAIENGRISRPSTESWEYGMVAEVSCHDDYSLIGERKLICESDGNWNHPFPKCKDVECPAPDIPNNVRMVSIYKPTYKYQEQISFRCEEGYEMEGDGRIVCGEDGKFSPPPPTCTPRKCDRPPELENGLLEDKYLMQKKFPSGSTVYYVCNPGYTFRQYSRRSIICNEGVWEPLRATCTPKSCGSPGEVMNGYYQGNNTFGSSVTFYCYEGYKLVGRNYRLCEDDGWGGQVPTCEVVKCPDIPAIENGEISRLSAESWEYGMVAEVSCHDDYSLIGERKLICESDGNWNHPFPKCKDVKCPAPDIPNNVRMVSIYKPTYKYQEQISFRCEEGYEMEGDGRIVCGEDGKFSPPPPTCTPRKCDRPPELENGLLEDKYLMQKKFPSGSTVYYVCNPGYTFRQYSRRSIICNEGVWEPLRATCTPKSCGSPGEIMNGYYQGNNTFGSSVTFYCYEGYKLVGRNYRLCEDDGWGGQVPTCEAVKCPDIPAIENGRISRLSTESWEYGMVAEVSCHGDYSLIGERKLICESDGNWNHPFPKCKDVKCPAPDFPNNVRMVSIYKPTYKYQEQISFRCEEGYEMEGDGRIVCGEDGKFSPPPPTCTPPSKRSHLNLIILGVLAIVIIPLVIGFLYKRNSSCGSLMRNKKRDLENGEALSHQMERLAPAEETK